MKIQYRFLVLIMVCLLVKFDNRYVLLNLRHNSIVLEGQTMGTFWMVRISNIPYEKKYALKNSIQKQLDNDENELSTWKTDSIISHFNQYRGSKPQPISNNISDIITLSLRIGYLTNGAMDITIGRLVNLWGFGPYKQPLKTPDIQQIKTACALTGLKHLKVINSFKQAYLQKDIPELFVDLSTVGEGFATDHLAKLMEKEGINNYLVSVGGAVMASGTNPQGHDWRVAIQKPTDQESSVQKIVNLRGHAISTSGSYRNYYELEGHRISHIIDPTIGIPIQHKLVSVTVISTTALEADAWDTGLMVQGIRLAKKQALHEKIAVYLIYKEGNKFRSWMSPQFANFL